MRERERGRGRGESGQCMHKYLCIRVACCASVKLSICRLSAHLHNFRTHIYGTLYPGTYLALFWPPPLPPLSSATRFVCFFCCPFASHTPSACPTATPILVFPIIALLIHINSLNVRRHCAFICRRLSLLLCLPHSLSLSPSLSPFFSLPFGIIVVALHSIIIRLAIIALKLLVSAALIGIYRIWRRQLDSLTIKAASRISSFIMLQTVSAEGVIIQ